MIKTAIHRIYTVLFNKSALIWLSGVLLFVIFHELIEDILANTLVKFLLSKIYSTWSNDLIAIGIFLGSLVFLFEKYNRYTASPHIRNLLLIFSGIYLYYHFFSERWVFTPFSFSSFINYFDVVVLISFGNLILFFHSRRSLPTNAPGSFFEDKPIGEQLADELGYTSYAQLLASKIQKSHFQKSFAIGINGKWGLGKTSFIDLIKRNLKNEEIIE